MVSAIVMIAVVALLFPFTSVTVKVTVFAPISAQVKSVWSRDNVATEQLSVEPLSISVDVMTALPVASNCTVIFCAATVGITVSAMVTTAVVALLLPLTSVTVKVTVFAPISAQVKSVWSRANIVTEQLSVELLSISAGAMVTFPLASNCTVIFCVMATGSI